MNSAFFRNSALAFACVCAFSQANAIEFDQFRLNKFDNKHSEKHDKKHGKKYHHKKHDAYFNRIATFPVYHNLDASVGDQLDDTTAAEISAASRDGNVVFYSDSPKGRVGLIDITNPQQPQAGGFIELGGEPTSVAVDGNYLLVGINTSVNYVQPSGKLSVYWIGNPLNPVWLTDMDMGGQPDSVAVSPDGRYAAVVIENERDEDLNDGFIPQLPAGHLMVVRMSGPTAWWQSEKVELSGYADLVPSDPEPEYVDINKHNIAAVSLQENNHIVLVDLRRAKVVSEFSAGRADLVDVDLIEDDFINPVDLLLNRKREPDALGWIDDRWIVTANEGDYEDENGEEGGSRGFTIFNKNGQVKYESGSSMEHALIRTGHYPESRSENKGIEPEAVTTARYGRDDYLFVGSERGSVVAVYSMDKNAKPTLHQILPTTIGPEGILTIPGRNLLVVSSEEDSADDGFRSTVAIYQYGAEEATYPEIQSDPDQLLPWGALSGMVAGNNDADTLYAVPDSYYINSRIYSVDTSSKPAIVTGAIPLSLNGSSVDYDLEGIAQSASGDFWLVSEGNSGSRPNLLVRAAANGTVLEEVSLPAEVIAKQISNGFEGVAVVGEGVNEKVLVAFQREWTGDPDQMVRIGVYTPANGEWAFMYYPIESAALGTWVGLSELTAIDDENFVVIERDNQQGENAAIKRLYQFSISGVTPAAEGGSFPVVDKTLVRDLMPDLQNTNGWVVDKVEGTAITTDGTVYVSTDNDGVDDSPGETRFMDLGKLFE